MSEEAPHILFLGLGYVARHLARRLAAEDWRIAGTARTAEGLDAIRKEGWQAWLFDGTAPLPAEAWEGVTHVLSSVPPDADGDPVLRTLGKDLCRFAPRLRWVGYLSTVGVYGDHDGAWVDETTPCQPVSERGRRRLEAEEGWLALYRDCGLPLHVFRLPGIYGPGRSPLDKARRRVRSALVVKPGQVFSRIHVEDLAEALHCSLLMPTPGEIYNVTDDEPAPPHEVALLAHELLGLEPPPLKPFAEIKDELSPMARSFYGESKRVSSRKIRERLGWRPRHPTYREGLRAILQTEKREDRGADRGPIR